MIRRIESDADVAEGARWLAQQDHRLSQAMDDHAPLPLRLKPDGFAQLLSAIVSQQVSTASAAAIWSRVSEAGLTSASSIRAASEADLQACGLSRPKIRYAFALANANIDYDSLRAVSSDEVVDTLTQVPGIGTWTAQIYALSSLGHADVFPNGDLALQEAARDLLGLENRPTEKEMATLALAWSPWRSVAARLLWSYYRSIKGREGIR